MFRTRAVEEEKGKKGGISSLNMAWIFCCNTRFPFLVWKFQFAFFLIVFFYMASVLAFWIEKWNAS